MVRRSAAGLAGAHQATYPVCRKFTLPKATRLVLVGQVVDRHGRSVGDMRAMPGRDPIRPTHYGAYKASYFDGYGLGGKSRQIFGHAAADFARSGWLRSAGTSPFRDAF